MSHKGWYLHAADISSEQTNWSANPEVSLKLWEDIFTGLYWARWDDLPSHFRFSVLILSFHLCVGFPYALFFSYFRNGVSYFYIFSVVRIWCPIYLSLCLFRLYNHEVSRYTVFNLKHLSKCNICTLAVIENRLIVTVWNSVVSTGTTCSNIKGLFILPQKEKICVFSAAKWRVP